MKTSIKYLWAVACVCMSACLFSCGDSDNDAERDEHSFCYVFLMDKSRNNLLDYDVEGALDTSKISVVADGSLLDWEMRRSQTIGLHVKYLVEKGGKFEFTVNWGNGWQDTILIVHGATKREDKLYVNGNLDGFVDPGFNRFIQLVRE